MAREYRHPDISAGGHLHYPWEIDPDDLFPSYLAGIRAEEKAAAEGDKK
jgi:hypothetical protein